MTRRGVTLLEMLIVVTIAGLIATLSFPALTSGLDALRLAQASDSIAAFLNTALTRAERRLEPVEITVSPRDNALSMRSAEPGLERKLALPAGVSIAAVWPRLPVDPTEPRRFLILPGATHPRFSVEIANQRGSRRLVGVDPLTGSPRIEKVESR